MHDAGSGSSLRAKAGRTGIRDRESGIGAYFPDATRTVARLRNSTAKQMSWNQQYWP